MGVMIGETCEVNCGYGDEQESGLLVDMEIASKGKEY